MKPSPEYCDEATKLHSLPVVIDWHRVDESILRAADLSSLASGPHYKPLSPDNLEIVRGMLLHFLCNLLLLFLFFRKSFCFPCRFHGSRKQKSDDKTC